MFSLQFGDGALARARRADVQADRTAGREDNLSRLRVRQTPIALVVVVPRKCVAPRDEQGAKVFAIEADARQADAAVIVRPALAAARIEAGAHVHSVG